ncbi:MAG: hypothetical protein V1891_02360 [bacterium]
MQDNFRKYNNFEIDDEEPFEIGKMKQQKIIFFSFLGFGIIALVLAIIQLRYSLKSPFYENALTSIKGDKTKARQNNDIFLTQNIDTDKDELTDYDELYVYETSPYLADSDSDGYNDKIELDSHNNPNCPYNGNCALFLDDGFSASSTASAIEEMYPSLMTDQSFAESDISLLRNMLIQQGISPELLNKISDEDLIREYASIMNGNSEEAASGDLNKDELKSLTPVEIRNLLESKGIERSILDSIDDETLKKDFEDTVGNL